MEPFGASISNKEEVSPPQSQILIEEIAKRIVKRGLEPPAIFLLEMNKPISFIIGESILGVSPLLYPLFGNRMDEMAELLKNREKLESLIRRIEELSREKNADDSCN